MERSTERIWLAGVLLFLIALRLPALWGRINLSPDATEYVDIARNFAAGEGLTLKIRAYFFGDGYLVPYPAASLRSPLFPVLLGSAYSLHHSDAPFRWLNLALFVVNMLLLSCLLLSALPSKLAIFALLLAGMTEPMYLTSIFPWAEQTALFWLLLATLMATRGIHRRWGAAGAALEGLVASAAGLSRPEYLLVGALFLAWLATREGPRLWTIAAFLAGFLVPLVGAAAASFLHHGRAFLPGDYLFTSRNWFAGPAPGPPEEAAGLASQGIWIVGRILKNFVNYLARLMGWKNLFALIIALPLAMRRALRAGLDSTEGILAAISAAFFGAYCLVWGGMDRERYLLAVTTFILPLCLVEVERWRRDSFAAWRRGLCTSLLVITLPLFLGNIIRASIAIRVRSGLGERYYARENPAWHNPDVERLASWIRANVGDNELVCLENPFLLNYMTGRMTVVVPLLATPETFPRFLEEYRARYWVNNTTFTTRSPDQLEGLERAVREGGAESVAFCGTYRIWRLL